jgi:hypothetical protein
MIPTTVRMTSWTATTIVRSSAALVPTPADWRMGRGVVTVLMPLACQGPGGSRAEHTIAVTADGPRILTSG